MAVALAFRVDAESKSKCMPIPASFQFRNDNTLPGRIQSLGAIFLDAGRVQIACYGDFFFLTKAPRQCFSIFDPRPLRFTAFRSRNQNSEARSKTQSAGVEVDLSPLSEVETHFRPAVAKAEVHSQNT